MDITVWLRSLGLGKYEALFRENDIDEAVLPSLTHENLKELGVASFGHRVKLLDAIAALRSDGSGKAPSANAATPPNAPSASPEDRAERRQVTVMFSDLVGSTALSARMDPEDLREVISDYQTCVTETVGRFNGFVAQYMGDGVVAYFGYPRAYEDDAERAVQAGLALVAAVRDMKTRANLQTRVGIATGLVVAGDLIGSGSQEQAVVGETPNLAARLQGVAEPNTVVIAESTRKLLGNLFEFQDLGAKDLKGIPGPVRGFAALRPTSVESRFEALHASGATELVGREEELELLLRLWTKAKAGEGQVVLLSGEAGIGKSRLTAVLQERLVTKPHARLRYFCSPQNTDSALYPIIGQMERAAGFTHDDTPLAKLDKLDTLLAQGSTSIQDATLFGEMLSLPNDGRYPVIELTPQRRRQKTLEALALQIVALSRQKPVLLIFEDAHWTDPTSFELFGRIVDKIPTLRVLLIVTFRPEFEPPWIGRSYVTPLTVNRLPEREVGVLIDRVVGSKLLSPSIRQDIIERTDGIPLFVEEMTKAVLEAGSESAAYMAAAVPLTALAVPASLHASLMARLDRLGPAKGIAQIGAVIGREFSHALLAAVASKPEPELQSALDRLIESGLLFKQGLAPHATYLFKHALVQDAAYGTLLREPRRALHARIADKLENQFAEIAENRPELSARHCNEAGLIEKAAGLWGKAGLRSLERSAFVEAIEQLTRAVGQIATLPETPSLRREQIDLQIALFRALGVAKGFAAPETKEATEQARLLIERAEALGEPQQRMFSVLFSSWAVSYTAFDGDALRELSGQFLALAEKRQAKTQIMIGHRMRAMSLMCTGDIVQSRAHYDEALALYDPAEHSSLATRFGQDARVAALCHRSWALWMLGFPEAAQKDAHHATSEARRIDHPATLMYALAHTCIGHILCRSYAEAKALNDELTVLAGAKDSRFWKAVAQINEGLVASASGIGNDAVGIISSGITAYRATGSTMALPSELSLLGRAYADLRQFSSASCHLREAMDVMEATGEKWFEAEANRLAGEIALMSANHRAAEAEASFERALTIARAQQAKSFELRASMSLARLWRDQGKVQQARDLLALVYGWFTEGFETRDLKEAKALLDELWA